jgi:hypothetical protein
MPVHRYVAKRPPEQADFVKRLAKEWQSTNSTAEEPVILEEPNRQGQIEHVYVVWGDWAHLDRTLRGEIIMDAAEKVKPKADVVKITIAMGLTPDEADRFGLKWRSKRTA